MDQETTVTREGRWSGGISLLKSSWQTLKMDKELAWLQVLNILASIGVFMGVAALAMLVYYALPTEQLFESEAVRTGAGILVALLYGTCLTFVANLFGGAIIAGATERFNGGDPSVNSSLKAAWARRLPLFTFSLLMTTVGLILRLVEERVPLGGKIATWLVGAAWNIANIFAVPVIILKHDIGNNPLNATRESVRTIKKVWGEGVVAQLGISLVIFLSTLVYIALAGIAIAGLQALTGSTLVVVAVGVLAFMGMMAMFLLFATLNSIVQAALYHLATTGEAPSLFSKRLLQAAFTPKKARKLFSL